nr:hypothetical protein [uncultured Rhodococcus sp.]
MGILVRNQGVSRSIRTDRAHDICRVIAQEGEHVPDEGIVGALQAELGMEEAAARRLFAALDTAGLFEKRVSSAKKAISGIVAFTHLRGTAIVPIAPGIRVNQADLQTVSPEAPNVARWSSIVENVSARVASPGGWGVRFDSTTGECVPAAAPPDGTFAGVPTPVPPSTIPSLADKFDLSAYVEHDLDDLTNAAVQLPVRVAHVQGRDTSGRALGDAVWRASYDSIGAAQRDAFCTVYEVAAARRVQGTDFGLGSTIESALGRAIRRRCVRLATSSGKKWSSWGGHPGLGIGGIKITTIPTPWGAWSVARSGNEVSAAPDSESAALDLHARLSASVCIVDAERIPGWDESPSADDAFTNPAVQRLGSMGEFMLVYFQPTTDQSGAHNAEC